MWRRCHCAEARNYSDYGGRGITVSEEWRDFLTFKRWAVLSGYAPDLEMDRADNDLGYSPDNCRWVRRIDNARNKRNTVMVEIMGEKIPITALAERMGVSPVTLRSRVRRGFAPHELLAPARRDNPKRRPL